MNLSVTNTGDLGDFIVIQRSQTLFSGESDLIITSDDESELINANGGDDYIIASDGSDTYNGFAGNDTVSYEDVAGPEGISIINGVGATGVARGDTFVDIENIIGTDNNDVLQNAEGGF